MPAKSKQQQKFFGVVKAMKKGDIPKKGNAGEVADDMDKKEIDKMASTKHKGLPKKIKEMIDEELQALNEVKPFVDNRLRTKYDYPKGNRDGLVYLATNDNRYPTEIVLYNQKRDVFHFVYSHSGEFTAGNTKTQTVPRKGFNSTHYVMPYFEEWEEDLGYERGFYEGKINEADRTSSISKQRAKAELKQQLKGKRSDGLGDYTAIVYGMNGSDRVPLKGMNDINKYSKFEIGDNEKALKEDNINEAKSAKALKADYEKAIKKEQALSSLMLMNLQKYKAAKASGDENAIAKFTKIAGQLSPKKKKASELASAAYQAYEDKISGLHADAELQIDEELKRVTKPMWDKMDGDARVNVVLTAVKDPDEAEQYFETEWEDLPSEVTQNIYLWEGKLNEASLNSTQKAAAKMNNEVRVIKKAMKNIQKISKDITPKDNNAWGNYILRGINSLLDNFTILETVYQNLISNKEDDAIDSIKRFEIDSINEALTLDGDGNYKYKKYVTKAFHKIHDAMFEFRHAMGVKQIGQDDKEIKKQLDAIHQAVVDLQNKLKSKGLTGGLTEAKLNEMDINDPILIAVRARQTALKKKAALPKVKKISTKQYYKLMDLESDIIDRMKDAAKEYQKLDSEMNQDAGQKGSNWTDADANRYGGDLNKLQTKIEKLAKEKLKVKKAIMSYRIN